MISNLPTLDFQVRDAQQVFANATTLDKSKTTSGPDLFQQGILSPHQESENVSQRCWKTSTHTYTCSFILFQLGSKTNLFLLARNHMILYKNNTQGLSKVDEKVLNILSHQGN